MVQCMTVVGTSPLTIVLGKDFNPKPTLEGQFYFCKLVLLITTQMLQTRNLVVIISVFHSQDVTRKLISTPRFLLC